MKVVRRQRLVGFREPREPSPLEPSVRRFSACRWTQSDLLIHADRPCPKTQRQSWITSVSSMASRVVPETVSQSRAPERAAGSSGWIYRHWDGDNGYFQAFTERSPSEKFRMSCCIGRTISCLRLRLMAGPSMASSTSSGKSIPTSIRASISTQKQREASTSFRKAH